MMVACKCGRVYAEGGLSFIRRGGQVDIDYKEMSVVEDDSIKKATNASNVRD